MGIIIDIIFIIVVGLIILINLLFRSVVKTTKNMKNEANLSGFEIARKVSSKFCKEEPHIIKKNGKYLDHYNKDRNVIKLSPDVFDGETIYAGVTAFNVALETDPERKNVVVGHKINSFLVIANYLFIILGAFANNILVIRLGLVLFILTCIIEFVLISSLFKSDEELNKLYEFIKKEKLIKPVESYKDYCLLLILSKLATLPYSFINYFR